MSLTTWTALITQEACTQVRKLGERILHVPIHVKYFYIHARCHIKGPWHPIKIDIGGKFLPVGSSTPKSTFHIRTSITIRCAVRKNSLAFQNNVAADEDVDSTCKKGTRVGLRP